MKPWLVLWGWLAWELMAANGLMGMASDRSNERPNILWITSEDNGPQLGCYGDTFADTPHIDRLAKRGMRYTNCWSNAPVCAPARTTIISGLFPTSLSAQHMRSQVAFPASFKLLPQYLRELGYYCSNNAKEDYNLATEKGVWDESTKQAHWRKRKPGQPFFAVFNIETSHESQIRKRPHQPIHDPSHVVVPPYHPDVPEVRQDWAQYYDQVTAMDRQVGDILESLQRDQLDDDTIIFYFGDHGSGMPRSKRWLYQSGLHVPMIVFVPPRYREWAGTPFEAGTSIERLISFVDLLPTMLSLAGEQAPGHVQGKAFLGKHRSDDPRYLHAFRDRMDERVDMSRAVRDNRYHYIRNFMPQRPQGTYLDYMFQTPTTRVWKQLYDRGQLNETQSAFWKAKAPEELYDLLSDPFELNNLADDKEFQSTLERFRGELKRWMVEICDLGLLPEGEVLKRAGSSPPYTFGHDASQYPVEVLFDAADLASRNQINDLPLLLDGKHSTESGVRYWTACGLLWRAQLDLNRKEILFAAKEMATDSSPHVRCIANEILARWGTDGDRAEAIHSLLALADANREGLFEAIAALNSLDWCQVTSNELGASANALPETVAGYSDRYGPCLPRLIERLKKTARP